ncbi:hypothetical protein HanXRQr2_Chr09g0384001 [Helianthus annuus]|uniref:Uncharacterized protein n=1 Tax=Helianthus annuus TaxID=4232 RepID=A0A9K3I5N9_HELAN|nr:hypothetical protein HanXRQr2_Chr09g0384001 [Helianthus annuus]
MDLMHCAVLCLQRESFGSSHFASIHDIMGLLQEHQKHHLQMVASVWRVGFKECLLADGLFLAKGAMEYGVVLSYVLIRWYLIRVSFCLNQPK